jgi:hypothetical protein
VQTVWSAAESDLGYETILFFDAYNKPKTAVIVGDKLVVRFGWSSDPV